MKGLKKLIEAISWDLQLEFKLEDFWIGAFWRQTPSKFDLWICLLPCLPIHFTLEKHLKNPIVKEYTALDVIKED